MIVANVAFREGDTDTNWGNHRFLVAPHAGDHAMLYFHGAPWGVVIERVYHLARPVDGAGPTGEPSLTLLVRRER